jgi:hypothetical protein
MQLRRVGPLSCAKVAAVLYAAMGLIIGAVFSMIGLVGGLAASAAAEGASGAFMGVLFGVGAIVLLPLLYGVMGFVAGLLSAAIYNVAASRVGGVELELE